MQLNQNNSAVFANSYTYDAMSRLATVSDGSNTATYSRISGSNLLNTTTITAGGVTKMTATRNYDAQNRLTSISSVSSVPSVVKTYSYTYDDKDRRSRLDLADGSHWLYTYDAKGQIVSGAKYDSTNKAIPGQAFGYAYDDIGNLTSEQRGMTEMQFDYTSNLVNQYTQRLVPGIIPVTGQASADSTVSVWLKNHGQNAAAVIRPTRDGEYFKAAIPVNNTAANVTEALEITAVKFNTTLDKDVVKTINGTYTVPQTPQLFTYDDDGNLLSDGMWNYTWGGENRLIAAVQANKTKLAFKYDYQGRRIEKKVYSWVNSAWALSKTERYAYDGWNLIAVYDGNSTLQKSYLWGIDLSGSLQGAGGVGGLLVENSDSTSYYPVYDGNGNVRTYVDASGALVAEYEYGPFGQINSKFGSLADNFYFRFSTKFLDQEISSYNFGIRIYDVDIMRWLSRDPMGEFDAKGNFNLLYGFVNNNPINNYDLLGAKTILTKVQCECAYEKAYAIFDEFRRENPPDTPLDPIDGWKSFFRDRHDCDWGATQIKDKLTENSSVAQAFGLSLPRRGKFTSTYPTLYYKETDTQNIRVYRFVRMHSVTGLKPQNGCEKYYTETVFDYMNGLAYGLSEFNNEFKLNVEFSAAGYYEVNATNRDTLVSTTGAPMSVAVLILQP